MTLQTFSAPTMAEALLQVKRAFGPDAVILHTRSVRQRYMLGLRRREVVEVTAGPGGERRRPGQAGGGHGSNGGGGHGHSGQSRGDSGARRQSPARPVAAEVPLAHARPARAANPALAAYARNSMTASVPVAPEVTGRRSAFESGSVAGNSVGGNSVGGGAGKSFFDAPEVAQAMVRLVTEEVTGLRSELRELVTHVRRGGGASGKSTGGAGLPEQLFEHYQRLIENQVAEELAEDVLKAVRLQVPQGYLANEAFVREKVAEQLEKLLPVSGPIVRTKASGPHVVALIGPTGVGKTTTIAKLAANLQLREGKRVGLITIDTYRIAAVDQLRRYADIIGSPLKVVGTPEDMPAAIASMGEMDYILIDTAGRSPTDTLKLSELRSFLDAAKPDEVHLVLSTTSAPRSVELAVASFSKVRVDKLLFTKVDEAASVGMVLNVARKVGLALSYVTTGQDVPDDIEVVRGRKLAQLILGSASAPSAESARESAREAVAKVARGAVRPSLVAAGGVQ